MNKNTSFHSINVRALLTIDRVCCVQAVGGDAVQAGARVPALQDVPAAHRQVAAASHRQLTADPLPPQREDPQVQAAVPRGGRRGARPRPGQAGRQAGEGRGRGVQVRGEHRGHVTRDT